MQLLLVGRMNEGYFCLISQEIQDQREMRGRERERETGKGDTYGEHREEILTKVLSKPQSLGRIWKKSAHGLD